MGWWKRFKKWAKRTWKAVKSAAKRVWKGVSTVLTAVVSTGNPWAIIAAVAVAVAVLVGATAYYYYNPEEVIGANGQPTTRPENTVDKIWSIGGSVLEQVGGLVGSNKQPLNQSEVGPTPTPTPIVRIIEPTVLPADKTPTASPTLEPIPVPITTQPRVVS